MLFNDALSIETKSVEDRIINEYEGVGGIRMAREPEVLVENMSQCRFIHHKSHIADLAR
jgi:hypothetical protein